MLLYTTTVTTKSSPAAVWRVYENPALWPYIYTNLEYAVFKGPFAKGTKGQFRDRDVNREIYFDILDAEQHKHFTVVTHGALGIKIIDTVVIDTQNDLTVLHFRIEVKGLLSPLVWIFRDKMIKETAPMLQRLIALVER